MHGPNGVTSVVHHNGCVFTTGRDGHCRQFSLNPDGSLTELTKFKVVPSKLKQMGDLTLCLLLVASERDGLDRAVIVHR